MSAKKFRLYPRLNERDWKSLIEAPMAASKAELESVTPPERLDNFLWASTGPQRITSSELRGFSAGLRSLGVQYGYRYGADVVAPELKRGAGAPFDVAAAKFLYENLALSANEAAHGGVWLFLALHLAPELIRWRFPGDGDAARRRYSPTAVRNAWSRLWWRAHLLFDDRESDPYWLLSALGEDEQVQITERRDLAGNRRVSVAFARGLVTNFDRAVHTGRMDVMRDAMKRMMRWMPWASLDGLDDDVLEQVVTRLFDDTFRAKGQPTSAERGGLFAGRAQRRPASPPGAPLLVHDPMRESGQAPFDPAATPESLHVPSSPQAAPPKVANPLQALASRALPTIVPEDERSTVAGPRMVPVGRAETRLRTLMLHVSEALLQEAIAPRHGFVPAEHVRRRALEDPEASWRDLLRGITDQEASDFLEARGEPPTADPVGDLGRWLLNRDLDPEESWWLLQARAIPRDLPADPTPGTDPEPIPAKALYEVDQQDESPASTGSGAPGAAPGSARPSASSASGLPYDLPLPTPSPMCARLVEMHRPLTIREALALSPEDIRRTPGVGGQKVQAWEEWTRELSAQIQPLDTPEAFANYLPLDRVPVPDLGEARLQSIVLELGVVNLEQALELSPDALAPHRGVGRALLAKFETWREALRDVATRLQPRLEDRFPSPAEMGSFTTPEPNPPPPKSLADLRDAIEAGLSEPELFIVRRYFSEGATLSELGEQLGRSRERVRQIVTKLIERVHSSYGQPLKHAFEQEWRLDELGGSVLFQEACIDPTVHFDDLGLLLAGLSNERWLRADERFWVLGGRRALDDLFSGLEDPRVAETYPPLLKQTLESERKSIETDGVSDSQRETAALLAELRRRSEPVHQGEIGGWLQLLDGLNPADSDEQTDSKYAIRAERRLMASPEAVRAGQGAFIHRERLAISREAQEAAVAWCLRRLDGETGPFSTHVLLDELAAAGFDITGFNHYILKDLLTRHPEVRALRKSHVAWEATYVETGTQLQDHVARILREAERPLSSSEVYQRLPPEFGYALSSVNAILYNAGIARPISHGGGFVLAEEA